jgi:hypothetical protein
MGKRVGMESGYRPWRKPLDYAISTWLPFIPLQTSVAYFAEHLSDLVATARLMRNL